jgi:hypothetical protein
MQVDLATESFLSLSMSWTRYEHWHAINKSTGIPLKRRRAIPDDLFICFHCVFPCSQYMSWSCTVHILALCFRRSTCLPVETPMQCLNTYRRLPPIWPGCWGNVRRSRPPRSNCPFRHCLLRLFAIADFIATKKKKITFWQSTNLNEKLHCPFRHVDDAQVLWISIQGLFWPRLPRWGSSLPVSKLKGDLQLFRSHDKVGNSFMWVWQHHRRWLFVLIFLVCRCVTLYRIELCPGMEVDILELCTSTFHAYHTTTSVGMHKSISSFVFPLAWCHSRNVLA